MRITAMLLLGIMIGGVHLAAWWLYSLAGGHLPGGTLSQQTGFLNMTIMMFFSLYLVEEGKGSRQWKWLVGTGGGSLLPPLCAYLCGY